MRDGAPSTVLEGAAGWRPTISSWSPTGELLAGDVPITRGRLDVDTLQEVPERLIFTTPEFAAGRSWVPGDDTTHPLAQYGQVVDLDITVTSAVSGDWTTRVGRYRIENWDHDDRAGTVTVECVGLLQIVRGDRFRTPQAPRPTGTLGTEFTRLMSDGIGVTIDPALVDRPVPLSFQWNDDRLSALYDIADAWPARLRVDQYGTARLLPPLPEAPTPVLRLTDGRRGTVIAAPTSGTRDDTFNVVVATSSATDSAASTPLQAVAEVTTGPLAVATHGPEVKKWSSPLAVTKAQLAAAARTMLANSIRPAVTQIAVIAPDPRIEADDAVEVVRAGTVRAGWVVGYSMPLTVEDGPMTVTVGVA